MDFRRALAVTKRIFRDLKNDRRTIGLMFVAPIMAMFVFGIAFSGDVKDVNVIVVNKDSGYTNPFNNTYMSISENITANLDTELLNLEYLGDEQEGIQRVTDGKAYAVLIFPEDFTRDLVRKMQNASYTGNTTIQLRLDKSNVNVAGTITKAVGDALTETMSDLGSKAPLKLDADNPIYGQNAEFMDFFVPGIMTFVVFLLTTLLTLISFVGERSSGTLERLLATPLRESEIVVGYAVAFGIIGVLQNVILLTIGITVFNIMVVGNIILAFFVIFLLAITSLSLGILLSSLAKREAQAVQFLPLIIFPVFLLAGIFWPVEAIPTWLRPASYIVPPTYAVEACRAVMIRGWGLEKIWMDVVALLAFSSVFLILATLSLRKRN